MRKATAVLVVGMLATAILAVFPAAAKTAVSFSADFKETFGRANSKPCDHFLCGTGTVAGYGDATSIFDLTSFSLIEGTSCGTLTAVRTITLSSDGSTLRLDEEGTACFPGESPTAPGAQHSFGNPGEIDTTFTVKKGTGVFQGAKGSGTDSVTAVAGDSGRSSLSGTLTFP
jgi:hypothetical protein